MRGPDPPGAADPGGTWSAHGYGGANDVAGSAVDEPATPVGRRPLDLHGRFEALCGAHRAELFRFAYWLARDRAVADDVVQDTLLRAWRSFAALGSETSAKSWLVAIARREFARRFERRTLECAGDADVAEVADPAPSAIDVQEADEVRAAILKLERAYREPLVLQVLMGHSVREIASILEITPAAVLTRLHRARHRLRAQLVLAAD